MSKGFILIEQLVSEAHVAANYRGRQDFPCVFYFQWFRQKNGVGGYDRFAEVYIAKEFSIGLIEKMRRKRNNLPIRIWDSY